MSYYSALLLGLVTDENGHLWVGISSRESGTLVEINPDTDTIISSIGRIQYIRIQIPSYLVRVGYNRSGYRHHLIFYR